MKDTTDTKYFLISLALHLTLLLVFTIKIVIFPGERPEYIRAVRVDFVALPDKDPISAPPGEEKTNTTPEEKTQKSEPEVVKTEKVVSEKPKKEPAPKEEKKISKDKGEKIEKNQIKEQQSSALQRLQALAKIKKMKSKQSDAPEGSTYKGNRLSDGNSLTGVEKIEHNRYLSQLDMHIKKNWLLPEWLADKALTAAVLVRFDENGNILERKILKASGNIEFDKEALQAVTASAPLPPPPENLISYFKVHGIELRFPE